MRTATLLLLSAAVGMSAFAGAANAAELRQIGTISIPGEPLNSFDISYIDQATGLYFLADRSNKGIDIVDTKKGTYVGRVGGMVGPVMKKDGTCCNNDRSGPNGVVVVNSKEAWVGDGDSTLKVIDLKTMKVTDTIKTGGESRADELAYDPKDQVIAIANNADEPPFLTFVSTKPGHKIIGKLVMEHFTDGMEQTAYNPADGLFYTDVPELDKDKTKGGLLVTDPKTAKIVKMIPVDSCVPHGIAFGKNGMVFLGCNAGTPRLGLPAKQVVVDTKTGKTVAEIQGVGGSDESAVNNKLDQYYGALNGNPDGPILIVVDSLNNRLVQKIPTGPGAHSVAVNESNGRVYVPIAVEAGPLKGGCGCLAVYGAE
jgi:DNA-binding beta-propeller fold protein YncE